MVGPSLRREQLSHGSVSTGTWRELTDEQLAKEAPVTMIREVLDPELATSLLEQLKIESAMWTRGTWHVRDRTHVLPRITASYILDPSIETEGDNEYGHVRRIATEEMRRAAQVISEQVELAANPKCWLFEPMLNLLQ